jgi:hypothetical protein
LTEATFEEVSIGREVALAGAHGDHVPYADAAADDVSRRLRDLGYLE